MNTITPMPPLSGTSLSKGDEERALLMICPAIVKLRLLLFIQVSRLAECDSDPLQDMLIAEDALASAEMVVDVLMAVMPMLGGPNPWSLPFQELTHAKTQVEINNIINRFADNRKRSMLRLAIACWHLRTIEGGINDDGAPGRHMTRTMYGQIDYAMRGFLEKWCTTGNAFGDDGGPDGEIDPECAAEFERQIAGTESAMVAAQKLLAAPSEDAPVDY